MHSKQQNQIRVLGQRCLASSFIFRSTNPAKELKDDVQKKDSNKDSGCISLSDFLDQKLHKNPVLPKTVKGKTRPFWSPVDPRDVGGSNDHKIGVKQEEGERNSVFDQVVFEQFKHIEVEKGDNIGSYGDGEKGTSCVASCNVGEVGTSKLNLNDGQGTRKRRNPFEGGDGKHATQKQSLVLGADPGPKQNGREERFNSRKRPRPLYNHYANGSGWWDCGMEGVDAEEVGFSEVWEGVGSTTFGGIEWH